MCFCCHHSRKNAPKMPPCAKLLIICERYISKSIDYYSLNTESDCLYIVNCILSDSGQMLIVNHCSEMCGS